MSQPRRRRRRGRKRPNSSTQARSDSNQKQPGQQPRRESVAESAGGGGSRRRRRGRGRRGGQKIRSPKSSEDLVRALPQERPESLTAPPDGQNLEELIGELQSTWGVPQYPQEYRLLIKVA